ncbi:MAG: flavodoxin family protein [Candidatus Odinarchaeia archaeon]
MKGIIVYESKYGNTRQVAEKIIEGFKKVKQIEVDLKTPKEIKPEDLEGYDFVLFGSPNHMGRATRGIRKFIQKAGKLETGVFKTALFDTYMSKRDYLKAVKSMEKTITEKTKNFKIIAPGLSIKVEGLKGPVAEGEFNKCINYGEKIIQKLTE